MNLCSCFLFPFLVSCSNCNHRINDDDRLIQAEGIESLSEAELREECRERGMLGLVSVEEMRQLVMPFLIPFPLASHLNVSWACQ